MSDTLDHLRLARTEGVGAVTYRRLLHRHGRAAAALDALANKAAAAGTAPPCDAATARRELDRLHRMGARLLVLGQAGYPALLAMLDSAPPVLALLGDADVLSRPTVAIVGARNASANGQRMAEFLAADLAQAGIAVVSGLARGVDAAAHAGALTTGVTIACIAGGLDVPYPAEHGVLQDSIAESGAVLAEAPLGTAPLARHFPRRNRIVAGLSLGVVVIEAAIGSGSLITAEMAQDAGREIFAVPGFPLDPRSRGANALIRNGAMLIESADDIIDALPRLVPAAAPSRTSLLDFQPPPKQPATTGSVADQVCELLSGGPTAVDDLIRRCQLSAAAVQSTLLDLELAERIERLPGNRVALRVR